MCLRWVGLGRVMAEEECLALIGGEFDWFGGRPKGREGFNVVGFPLIHVAMDIEFVMGLGF